MSHQHSGSNRSDVRDGISRDCCPASGLMSAATTAEAQNTPAWDKTFPKSEHLAARATSSN